jgi:hypothetical protein
MADQSFFITTMPSSRPADYYLGYMEGSVFLDFNNYEQDKVCLARISFDGYGCYELGEEAIPLDESDSQSFKTIIRENIGEKKQFAGINKTSYETQQRINSV